VAFGCEAPSLGRLPVFKPEKNRAFLRPRRRPRRPWLCTF